MDVVAFWLQQAREPNLCFGPKLPTVKDILLHLAEAHPHHAWHASRPVCTVCGLHLKAHWRRVKIQRAIQQPCGTEVHHLVHLSHQMQCCNSKGWRCVKCGKKGTMNCHEPFNFQAQLAADLPEAGKAPETSVVRVRIHLGCVALRKNTFILIHITYIYI